MGRLFLQRQWQVCENWVPLDVFFFVCVFVGYGMVVVHHFYRFRRAVLAYLVRVFGRVRSINIA